MSDHQEWQSSLWVQKSNQQIKICKSDGQMTPIGPNLRDHGEHSMTMSVIGVCFYDDIWFHYAIIG